MRTSLRVFAAAVSTCFAAAFLVIIPSASPAHAVSGVNIVNIGNGSNTEGGIVDVPISLNYGAIGNVSVTVSTAPLTASSPSDYQFKSQTFNWSFGQGQVQHFMVQTNQDITPEADEQFRVVFSQAPVGADPGSQGTGTIVDNDGGGGTVPKLTVSGGGTQPEGNADNVRDITVTLDKVYDQDVTVNYATQDGTAQAPGDYTAIPTATLTFPKNVNPPAPQVIHVGIKGDGFGEPTESFQVIFGSNENAVFNGTPNQTITLTNDDGAPPTITIADITPKAEGDSGTSTMTVTLNVTPTPQQPVSVQVDTADGTAVASTQDAKGDYEPVVKKVVTINGPSTSVDVTINGDIAQEPDETFHVNLSKPNNAVVGAPSSKDGTILNDDFGQITVGPGPGGGPDVETFGAAGAHLAGFYAYEAAFAGGVHVARGDFFKADGSIGADGIDEIVTAPGKNSRPLVRIFALDGTIRASFFAYDQSFAGGVYLAAGNFDGDTSNGDELVVAAGPGGGPHVKVIKVKGPGDNIIDISNGGFYAYAPNFHGGVRLAAANMTGDAKDEIITAPGPGGGPHVKVFGLNNTNSFAEKAGFMAYDPGFGGGVFVAATAGKIVTGAGAGGGPHVRIFNGDGSPQGGGFFAYDPNFHGGVSVAMGNMDNDPAAEIATGPGAGGGPHVRVFDQDGGMPFGGGFFAYQNFTGGIEVSIGGGGN